MKDSTPTALDGRAHRAPNAHERDHGDRNARVANPALRGKTIDTVGLVADHRVGRDPLLRASVYRWAMHVLVTPGMDPGSGLTQYGSGGDVNARGVALSAGPSGSWGAPASAWTLDGLLRLPLERLLELHVAAHAAAAALARNSDARR